VAKVGRCLPYRVVCFFEQNRTYYGKTVNVNNLSRTDCCGL